MREYSISGSNVYIQYPDPFVWLGDNNTIIVTSNVWNDKVGARVVVREPQGQQIYLEYSSERNSLVFLLNDTLKRLFNNHNLADWDVAVEVYRNQTFLETFYFQMKVYSGKSYQDRSHAATRVIYWSDYSEITKLQLFSYESGTATIQNVPLSINSGITSLNLIGFHLRDTEKIQVQTTANEETTPQWLGDMWYNSRVPSSSYTITLQHITICDDNIHATRNYTSNACRIFYYDADGCGRWIGGKILKVTDNAQGDTYSTITKSGIYRNIVDKWNTKTSKVVTVGFSDIDNLAYLQDIIYSDSVQMVNYNGDLFNVAIDTKKLTVKDFLNDFEIDFIVNNEN